MTPKQHTKPAKTPEGRHDAPGHIKETNEALQKEIAGRKRAEEAVREALEMQRAVFDSTTDFIWAVDSQRFGLLTFNRAFQDYFLQQYKIRLHVGQRLEDLGLRADYIERWRGYFQRALASGPFSTEYLMASGKYTHLLTFNLLKINEAVYGVSVFGEDITGRRQAEEALRRSETKFRTFYESSSDALLLSDENGSLIDCNPAGLAMFGCATVEEFCSKHPADLSPPTQPDGTDSRTLANRHIATALEKGSRQFEWMHKRINSGEAFPAEVHLNAMTLGDKRVILGSVRDITERKRAEESLARSELRFRTLIEKAPMGISISRNGSGIYANPKLVELFRLRDAEECVGRPVAECFAPQCREEGKERSRRRSLGLPVPVEYEAIGLRSDGSQFPIHVTVAQVQLVDGMADIAFLKDITERKRAEEALRESEAKLRGVFECSRDAIGISRDGLHVFANSAFLEMFGFEKNEQLAGTSDSHPHCPKPSSTGA